MVWGKRRQQTALHHPLHHRAPVPGHCRIQLCQFLHGLNAIPYQGDQYPKSIRRFAQLFDNQTIAPCNSDCWMRFPSGGPHHEDTQRDAVGHLPYRRHGPEQQCDCPLPGRSRRPPARPGIRSDSRPVQHLLSTGLSIERLIRAVGKRRGSQDCYPYSPVCPVLPLHPLRHDAAEADFLYGP